MTVGLIGKIDSHLHKAVQLGYNGNLKLLSKLLHDAEVKLYKKYET